MTSHRTYETTHPWLTFAVDLTRASAPFWIMVGKCQSKCEHIANVPLRPALAEELHWVYLAKGALASAAIEGNTLSEEQVRQHLDGELRLPPSQEYLEQEVKNIIAAANEIMASVGRGEDVPLTSTRAMDLNRLTLRGLSLSDEVAPGQLRTYQITVGNVYRGAPPEDCAWLLEELFAWLNGDVFIPPDSMKDCTTIFAIIRAALAHLYMAWIHPFGDGNGRTARLIELQILLSSGIASPAAHLLSNHYNQTRAEYYRQLDYASRSGGDVLPFLEYSVRGFLDGLDEQLRYIWRQQHDIAWRDYVYDCFRDKTTAADIRRRHLILDLSVQAAAVKRSVDSIMGLTPRLAHAYVNKTYRTMSRDFKVLDEMGLVDLTPGLVQARKQAILAFLPTQAS